MEKRTTNNKGTEIDGRSVHSTYYSTYGKLVVSKMRGEQN